MTQPPISIGGRLIGPGCPPLIVAELSANHNGDFDRAVAIMEAAREAGAEAVKLQTYTPDTMTLDESGEQFTVNGGLWHGETLYDLYRKAHTPWEWHEALFEKGRELGLIVFSTPFDDTSLDFLEKFDPPAYKIASFELVDIPLIEKVAAKGKPLILSTGMGNIAEISDAVEAVRHAGCRDLILMHCVSAYPAAPEEANLKTMADLEDRFHTLVGLSDHTLGTAVSISAVALGASMIEKHCTLRRDDGGPDSAFSLEPEELRSLCEDARNAWKSLGNINYDLTAGEEKNTVFRRSLYVVKDIAAGEPFSRENMRSIRPGYGLPPKCLDDIIGKKAACAIRRGVPLDWSMVEK